MFKRIIIAGYGTPVEFTYRILKKNFDVIGIVIDYDRTKDPDDFNDFLNKQKLRKFRVEEIKDINPDLLFVINYNKFIKGEDISGVFTLNLHMGILPKYRGNNANAWAVLNGENDVGYTIHEVNSILDGGDIFYIFKYRLKLGDTYSQAKNAINTDIQKKLNNLILNILNVKLPKKSQVGQKFVYCSKLVVEDGIITSWGITNDEILRRFIVFAKPLGTGLKFIFKNDVYEINKISTIPSYEDSRGIPGAIVMKTMQGSIWVKTLDNALSIDEICYNNIKLLPAEIFKIGERL